MTLTMTMHAYLLALSFAVCYSNEASRILPALSLLCPNQNVCFSKLRANSTSDDSGGCCTECSCEPDCSLEGNCCFTSMDYLTDRRYQSCLSTQLKESTSITQFGDAYYMINEKPEEGCVRSSTRSAAHMNESCCDTGVAPWGSFAPVTSLITGMIYKNQKFADCHGDSVTMAWMAYLACETISSVYEDLSGCNIFFINPGNKHALRSKRCFTDAYGKCPENFKMRKGVGMSLSREEILTGCESDFQSQFSMSNPVKNAYCFMCITGTNLIESSLHYRYCLSQSDVRLSLGETNSFISVLDFNDEGIDIQDQSESEVCEVRNDHMIPRCWKLLCPLGQDRSSITGRCSFVSKTWTVKNYVISVKVEFDSTVYGLSNRELLQVFESGDFYIPWKRSWKLRDVFIESIRSYKLDSVPSTLDGVDFSENSTATHFYARIIYNGNKIDPMEFLSAFNNNLNTKWVINWRNHNYSMHQIHSPSFTCPKWLQFLKPSRLLCAPHSRMARFDNQTLVFEDTHIYQVESTFVKKTGVDRPRMTHSFSKLMSCSQVELKNDEFKILYSYTEDFRRSDPALVVTKAGNVLSDYEFKTAEGKLTVKVCLEDTGFVITASSGSSRCVVNGLIRIVILTTITLTMTLTRLDMGIRSAGPSQSHIN